MLWYVVNYEVNWCQMNYNLSVNSFSLLKLVLKCENNNSLAKHCSYWRTIAKISQHSYMYISTKVRNQSRKIYRSTIIYTYIYIGQHYHSTLIYTYIYRSGIRVVNSNAAQSQHSMNTITTLLYTWIYRSGLRVVEFFAAPL